MTKSTIIISSISIFKFSFKTIVSSFNLSRVKIIYVYSRKTLVWIMMNWFIWIISLIFINRFLFHHFFNFYINLSFLSWFWIRFNLLLWLQIWILFFPSLIFRFFNLFYLLFNSFRFLFIFFRLFWDWLFLFNLFLLNLLWFLFRLFLFEVNHWYFFGIMLVYGIFFQQSWFSKVI